MIEIWVQVFSASEVIYIICVMKWPVEAHDSHGPYPHFHEQSYTL